MSLASKPECTLSVNALKDFFCSGCFLGHKLELDINILRMVLIRPTGKCDLGEILMIQNFIKNGMIQPVLFVLSAFASCLSISYLG